MGAAGHSAPHGPKGGTDETSSARGARRAVRRRFRDFHRRRDIRGRGRREDAQGRLRRRDQRSRRRLGHIERALDANARRMVERKGRREDRRRHLQHRRRHVRRPEGPQAGDRRHGEDGAGGRALCRRPQRRRRRRRGAPGRREGGDHLFPLRLPQGALHQARVQRGARHGRELPVGSGDLQISERKEGREDDRVRRGERIRSAQPARRRRRRGQGARSYGRSRPRTLIRTTRATSRRC